jgi:hypothetical protein
MVLNYWHYFCKIVLIWIFSKFMHQPESIVSKLHFPICWVIIKASMRWFPGNRSPVHLKKCKLVWEWYNLYWWLLVTFAAISFNKYKHKIISYDHFRLNKPEKIKVYNVAYIIYSGWDQWATVRPMGNTFSQIWYFQTYETNGQHSEIFGNYLWQFFTIYP